MEKLTEGEQSRQEIAAKITDDPIVKLRRSCRNRESYDEIADLEAELRRAYVAKELRVQLQERETERFIENVRKQRAAKLMRLEQQTLLENDLRQTSDDIRKRQDYREELSLQIKRKQEERNAMAEEARAERETLTEVDRITEEYERSKTQQTRNQLAESTRRERLILQEMKEIRRHEDMEAEAKKRHEDEEYLREIERRENTMRKLRQEQTVNREKTLREIASVLINVEARKRERETLIAELIAVDVKRELIVAQAEENVERRRKRMELAANLEEQIVLAEQCKLRFVQQDRAFAVQIMNKVMEDERIAMLTAEARRRMRFQYRDDLTRLIETRRKIREEEIYCAEEAANEEKRREAVTLRRVGEERKRLLQQHASNDVVHFLNEAALTEDERNIIARVPPNS